jgi:hypothetical protein
LTKFFNVKNNKQVVFVEKKVYICVMERKKSIINWEVHQKLKSNKISIQKDIKTYKKPILGQIWDKICIFGQKIRKKPIFSALFIANLILVLEYGRCSYFGESIDLFRWVTTSSFLVFFGYMTFFDKN